MPETIQGLVERVTYHNADNGFCVLQVRTRQKRDLATVVGKIPRVHPGESIEATGEWKVDRQHGAQFEATELRADIPTEKRGMEKYLGSGLIHGIGPELAKRMIEKFGTRVFEVIEQYPSRLREVGGIGEKRAKQIGAGWTDQKTVRELMVFLHSHGVGTARAVRIYKTYGVEAIRMISENPYRLADEVRGIGFLSADAIAQRLGFEKTSLARARAGISYVLGEAVGEGHCALPDTELLDRSEKLLDIPREIVQDALGLELAETRVLESTIRDRRAIFLTTLFNSEKRIAEDVRRIAAGRLPWPPIDASKAIGWVESKIGIRLAPTQRDAVTLALKSKFMIITGGPGVGKTTLVNSIIRIVGAKGANVILCAPTGRAAKRLQESTGREAKTIHRVLEIDARHGGFRRGDDNPIECDLLVVDESSMLDVPLMESLLRAVPLSAAVLMIGDVDQLPSVGPGQVLADLIGSRAVPVVKLTEIFRQAAASTIIVNAHRVNHGEMPQLESAEGADFYFINSNEPLQAQAKVLQMVSERIPARFGLDPMRDVQVLVPMHKGDVGVQALNRALQAALNPDASQPSIERFGTLFRRGDKVMQIENDYDKEVFNGDIGIVREIDVEERALLAEFDGRGVEYAFDDLDQLVLAYATTIHKSQGSEYPAVVIPIMNQHYVMLQRNLLYTAITRGKRLVVLIGQRGAVERAVKNGSAKTRWTKLREWMG